jgi:dihydrofolate reductase
LIVSIIAAIAENHGIGKDNDIPWHLRDDLKRFKHITMGHHLVMGRRTFESIGKPLPGRHTIVISRNRGYRAEGCIVVHSLPEALETAQGRGEREVFIVGGEQVFGRAMAFADKMYITHVHAQVEADVFFPEFDERKWKVLCRSDQEANAHNQFDSSFIEYERVDLTERL